MTPNVVKQDRPKNGFSLIEVMVALFIFALSVGAMITAMGGATRTMGALDDRLYAEIAAENKLVETLTSDERLQIGYRRGLIRVGEREFRWTRQVRPTGRGNIAWVEISIQGPEADGDQVIAALSSFRETD